MNVLLKHFLNRVGGVVFPGSAVAGCGRVDDDITVCLIYLNQFILFSKFLDDGKG